MGFKALGLETRPAANADEARRILHTLARSEEDYAIIYVEETFAADGDMAREIARYKDLPKPAVILIPGREGPLGIGMSNIQKSIQRAVGADIL